MIVRNVNQIKLHKELSDAGVPCTLLATEEGAEIIFLSDEVDIEMVQQIISAHNPTPIVPPLSDIEKLRIEQAQANSELVQLIMLMGGA